MLVVSALGGAVLERYLLPALPVVYIAFAVSLGALSAPSAPTHACGAGGLPARGELHEPALSVSVREQSGIRELRRAWKRAPRRLVEQQRGALCREADGWRRRFRWRMRCAIPISDSCRRRGRSSRLNDFSRPEVGKLKEHAPDMLVVYRRDVGPAALARQAGASADFLTRHYGYMPEMRAEADRGNFVDARRAPMEAPRALDGIAGAVSGRLNRSRVIM